MDERIKQIFVIMSENRVVCVDNTLTGLQKCFKKRQPKCPGYLTLFKKMKPDGYCKLEIDGKTYHIDKFEF